MKRVLILGLVIVALVGVGLLGAMPFLARDNPLPNLPLPQLVEGDFVVKVLGEDGKYIPASRISYNGSGLGERNYADRFVKPDGTLKLPFKHSEAKALYLTASAPGHATMHVQWRQNPGGTVIPAEFTFNLKKGTTIGGTVHNPQGEPVRGVKVSVSYGDNQNEAGKPHVNGYDSVQTDAAGKWRMKTAPESAQYYSVEYSHPHYVTDRGQSIDKDELARYRKFTVDYTLKEGLKIVGKVTDPEGKPIVKAFVALGRSPYDNYRNNLRVPTTRGDGSFEIRNARPGSDVVTVFHPDWAPAQQTVTVGENMEPLEFQLAKGGRVEFIIKDQSQRPVQGARAYPSDWKGSNALNYLARYGIPTESNEDGRVVWENAPLEEIDYYVTAVDYTTTSNLKITPRKDPYQITLNPPRKITGEIVDAKTGSTISDFQMSKGYKWEGNDQINWQRWEPGSGGKFEITDRGDNKFAIRVRAEGYLASESPVFTPDQPIASHKFELSVGVGPEGEIYTADGKAVEGAQVGVYTSETNAQVYNGEIQDSGIQLVTTGSDGKFKLDPQSIDYAIVAVHATGFAQATQAELTKSSRLILQPWSKVEGQVLVGKEPQKDVSVNLNSNREWRQGEPNIYFQSGNVTTNGEGKFTFDRVCPGPGQAYLMEMVESPQGTYGMVSRSEPFDVAPGETAQVTLGGSGRPVTGKIVVPEALGSGIDLTQGAHTIQEKPKPQDAVVNALNAFVGNRRQPMQKNFQFRIKEDGTFRVEDVPPGDYVLQVYARQPNPQQPNFFGGGQTLGHVVHEFSVADVPEGEEASAVELGDLELQTGDPQPR